MPSYSVGIDRRACIDNARNELTGSVRSDSGSWDYDYDNIGNRLSSSDSQGQTEYVSNGLNQYLRRGVGGGLRYDADGNLTNIGSAADLDGDGDVDVDDFVIFQPQLTGPLAEVAAAAMAMEQMAAPMALMAAPQAEAVVVEPWTDEESSATLRVKGLSGGPALTVLQLHTTYQLHYRAGVEEVNGFMVSVYADGDAQEISGVTASTGEWSDADVFEFIDMATAGGDPTYDGNGCMLRQIVHGFWFTGSGESVEELADRRGQLFQFTTGDAGTIHFELFMDWIDVASRGGVWMRTDLTVEVVDPMASASSASDVMVADSSFKPYMGFDAQFGSALVAALLATGGTEPEFALADLDGDGDADLADFAMFQAAFGVTGGTGYTWNTENRLAGVEPLAPNTDDKKLRFAYDHMGRRVLKRVWTYTAGSWGNPTAETKYVYDGWRVIMELDGLNSDAVTRRFTWGLDLSGSVEGAGGIGGLLATEDTAGTTVTTDDRSFIYFYELNGNVGQLVETTTGTDYGTIAAKYEYDPYGKRINTATQGEYDQPYRFSTKPVDEETGLGNWGYRYYSYDLGRWVSRDPIGEAGAGTLAEADTTRIWPTATAAETLQEYSYCLNRSVDSLDAIGLCKVGERCYEADVALSPNNGKPGAQLLLFPVVVAAEVLACESTSHAPFLPSTTPQPLEIMSSITQFAVQYGKGAYGFSVWIRHRCNECKCGTLCGIMSLVGLGGTPHWEKGDLSGWSRCQQYLFAKKNGEKDPRQPQGEPGWWRRDFGGYKSLESLVRRCELEAAREARNACGDGGKGATPCSQD